jgi:hypothetical protein
MVLFLDFWKRHFMGPKFHLFSHIEIPMTHPQLQCHQGNWDCLNKSGWNLRMTRVCVGQTLRRPSSSVNLHGGFDKSLPYWRLIHLTSSESQSVIFCHHFMDTCNCVCSSRGRRTPTSWIILKILTPIFKSFKHSDILLWLKATTMKMEAIRSSETSVHTRFTRRHNPKGGILRSRRRETLKSYITIDSL